MLGFGCCLMISGPFCFICFMASVSLTGCYPRMSLVLGKLPNLKPEFFEQGYVSLKAGSHIIAAIVSIAAVNSKSGLAIGTIT